MFDKIKKLTNYFTFTKKVYIVYFFIFIAVLGFSIFHNYIRILYINNQINKFNNKIVNTIIKYQLLNDRLKTEIQEEQKRLKEKDVANNELIRLLEKYKDKGIFDTIIPIKIKYYKTKIFKLKNSKYVLTKIEFDTNKKYFPKYFADLYLLNIAMDLNSFVIFNDYKKGIVIFLTKQQ